MNLHTGFDAFFPTVEKEGRVMAGTIQRKFFIEGG
jgi:hypothetical protein